MYGKNSRISTASKKSNNSTLTNDATPEKKINSIEEAHGYILM